MNKKFYRYFFGFIDTQEKWLNTMSSKGYRLVRTTRFMFEFEQCDPSKYQYAIDYVAHKSYKEMIKYKNFLEDLGYTVFTKNINSNYSFGKIRIRPYGKGAGKITTSPGSYNKELLIVERINNDKSFELHTTFEDKIQYYKPIRNAYLSIALLAFALSIWNYISTKFIDIFTIFASIWGFTCIVALISYQSRIFKLKNQQHLQD